MSLSFGLNHTHDSEGSDRWEGGKETCGGGCSGLIDQSNEILLARETDAWWEYRTKQC